MIKFLNNHHLDHVSSTTLISMYDHGTVTLEIIIRPPLNVWHTKNGLFCFLKNAFLCAVSALSIVVYLNQDIVSWVVLMRKT